MTPVSSAPEPSVRNRPNHGGNKCMCVVSGSQPMGEIDANHISSNYSTPLALTEQVLTNLIPP